MTCWLDAAALDDTNEFAVVAPDRNLGDERGGERSQSDAHLAAIALRIELFGKFRAGHARSNGGHVGKKLPYPLRRMGNLEILKDFQTATTSRTGAWRGGHAYFPRSRSKCRRARKGTSGCTPRSTKSFASKFTNIRVCSADSLNLCA